MAYNCLKSNIPLKYIIRVHFQNYVYILQTTIPILKSLHFVYCIEVHMKLQISSLFYYTGINILLGLYLFGDKIANPEEFDAFYVMIALVVLFAAVDFSLYLFFLLSRSFCEDRTTPTESEREMKDVATAGDPPPKPKKDPSPVTNHLFKVMY